MSRTPDPRDDRGSMTMWMLGLTLLLLAFGGLAIDYWRGLALQRELAAVADSAAIAGASGIDEVRYRQTGEVVLDPNRATALAMQSIEFQGVSLASTEIAVSDDGTSVEVSVEAVLDLGLLGVLVDDDEPILVGAAAIAEPVLLP